MSAASLVQASKTPQPQPGIDKTLIGGTIAGGITGAVLFGGAPGFLLGAISSATGYLAGKANITGSLSRFTSFIGKAAAPAVALARFQDLTNFNLISSLQNTVRSASKVVAQTEDASVHAIRSLQQACTTAYKCWCRFREVNLPQHCYDFKYNLKLSQDNDIPKDPNCMAACRNHEPLDIVRRQTIAAQKAIVDRATPQLIEAVQNNQYAVALMTEVLGIGGAIYCFNQLLRAKNDLESFGWLLGTAASAFSALISFLETQAQPPASNLHALEWRMDRSLQNRLAQFMGGSASIYSAYKTVQAFRANKLLDTLQWLTLSIGSGFLAYAASNLPDIK